jgi:UDP-N-acetylmuramate dehydrogenase
VVIICQSSILILAELIECTSVAMIEEALEHVRAEKKQFVVVSGGSNVLVSDDGFDGVVILIRADKTIIHDGVVTAEAGISLYTLIQRCHEHGLGGWEKLAGIPGSLGGAIRGNAGAFGSEIREFVTSVTAVHAETGERKDFVNDACDFSYRHSFFKENPEWVIVRAELALLPVDETAPGKAKETVAEREKRHLQNVACAGSYFMNPVAPQWVQDQFATEKHVEPKEGRVPAGWLIEKVGLKGFRIGNACASQMHPNYVMNMGGATAADVRAVARTIQDKVKKEFLTDLSEEASLLGF